MKNYPEQINPEQLLRNSQLSALPGRGQPPVPVGSVGRPGVLQGLAEQRLGLAGDLVHLSGRLPGLR